MSKRYIQITGVTPKISRNLYSLPHNEITQTQKLLLSKDKGKIKKIISVDIKVDVNLCEENLKVFSHKIVINAIKKIQIEYEDINNDTHTAKYNIPFEIPIILNSNKVKIEKVVPTVTKLSVKMINSRAFYLTSRVFISLSIDNVSTSHDINSKTNENVDCENINSEQCKKKKHHKKHKTQNNFRCNGGSNFRCNGYNNCNYNNPLNVLLCLILIIIILNRFNFRMF